MLLVGDVLLWDYVLGGNAMKCTGNTNAPVDTKGFFTYLPNCLATKQ